MEDPVVRVVLADFPEFKALVSRCETYMLALQRIAKLGWHPVNGHIIIATAALGIEEETKPSSQADTSAKPWECQFCKNVFMQPGTYYCINCARCPHGVRAPHECREGCESDAGVGK